jgi:hypothetical protein
VGFPYASFLLGGADSAAVHNTLQSQARKTVWSFFLQDTWKITHRLTLDYGLRYDLQGGWSEMHQRASSFASAIPNPSVGNLPGAKPAPGPAARNDGPEGRVVHPPVSPREGCRQQ